MPIDFNRQMIFDPKIDIIGKEVPLAEIEKTGNVLQGRYDQSYEQYSMADEALKQMEASANAVDREKAAELRKSYNDEMKGVLEKGDFHNMRHQTANLARNAAMNYKIIGDRNAEIEKHLDDIAKNPKYRLDPEGAKQEYLKSLKSVNINPENRTISDFNVGTYNGVADVNIAEKLLPIAPTLRAKFLKGKGSYFDTQTTPDGQKVLVVRTESGGVEKLPPGEIERELLSYIKTDPEVQAYIKRDVGRAGLDINTPEGQEAYQKLLLERTQDTTKALGNMYEINKDERTSTFTVPGGMDGNGSGDTPNSLSFTERTSNVFKNNLEKPFTIDAKGNITNNKMQTIPFARDEFGVENNNSINTFNGKNLGQQDFENSTNYKRLKNLLTEKGVIKPNANKRETNLAIADYWNNQIADATSSITVAKAGNKAANDYVEELNRSFMGTTQPNVPAKGSSIKNGQLAMANFTNEKGKLMSAQQVSEEVSDRDVRIDGWVSQPKSPFEYGSYYMVARAANGEQKSYLIEPDNTTKNSGAYFANRIYNSINKADLVSKWKDGNGMSYEATPIKGGSQYIVYVNGDDKTPLILSSESKDGKPSDLDALSKMASGEANQALYNLYNSKKR